MQEVGGVANNGCQFENHFQKQLMCPFYFFFNYHYYYFTSYLISARATWLASLQGFGFYSNLCGVCLCPLKFSPTVQKHGLILNCQCGNLSICLHLIITGRGINRLPQHWEEDQKKNAYGPWKDVWFLWFVFQNHPPILSSIPCFQCRRWQSLTITVQLYGSH